MKTLTRAAAFAVVFLLLAARLAAAIHVPVALRPGVSAHVVVQSYANPAAPPDGIDVLLVHGLAQTGATFAPLTQELFGEHMGDKIATVYVADLPGHGASPLPSGILFGALFLEDYTTAVLAVIDAVDPDVVIAHSMGAVIVQMAQERLAVFGTTLRAAYGVRGAVLLAPVIPLPIPWSFVDSGAAAGILGSFITFDPALGVHVDFPPPFWVAIFYANRSGGVAAGAPNPADALANGWIAPESFYAGAQTVRLFAPPFVRANVFGGDSGTVAGVVTMAQDAFFLEAEHRDLYVYLTGDDKLKFYSEVEGADAVHNVHTFDPAALVHPIKKVINAIDR